MLGSFDLSLRLLDTLPLLLRFADDLFCVSCSQVRDLLERPGRKVIGGAFDVWGLVPLSAFASDPALDAKSFEIGISPLSKHVSAKLVSPLIGCTFSGGCTSPSLGPEVAFLSGGTGKLFSPNSAPDVYISWLALS